MNRSRLYTLLVLLVLTALAGCAWLIRSAPATPTNPANTLLGTVVAQTLTAYLSLTPEPSLTATATPTMISLPPQTPREFIVWYFDGINSRNYLLTWTFLSERYKNSRNGTSPYGYLDYVTFWDSVKQVSVIAVSSVCQGDVCAVNVTLQLNFYNGKSETDPIPYTLTYDHTRGTWLFDYIPLATATPTHISTATLKPTKTRTPTPSLTPTQTLTRTPKTRTPTATRTSTPTHKPTKTATISRTPSPTKTHKPTNTWTPSNTPPETPTFTASPADTETPTPTLPATETGTPTLTASPSASETATSTLALAPASGSSRAYRRIDQARISSCRADWKLYQAWLVGIFQLTWDTDRGIFRQQNALADVSRQGQDP